MVLIRKGQFNGDLLYHRRLEQGLTLMQLGILVGCRYMQIARWEQGIAQPHPGNLSALAKALLVHPSYFFQPKNMSEMVSVVTLARQRQRKAKKTIRRNSDIA